MVRSLNDTLSYIGVDDLRIGLFESQYPVPEGISYNSYVLRAGKTAVFDTVDASAAEQWKANLGIEVTINQQPFKNRLDAMQTGNFDVVLAGWVPDYNDPMTYLDMFMTTNGNNYGKYSNEQYDSLLTQAMKESDFDERVSLLVQAEQLGIAEDVVVAPIYFQSTSYAVSDKVKNMTRTGFQEFDFTDIRE